MKWRPGSILSFLGAKENKNAQTQEKEIKSPHSLEINEPRKWQTDKKSNGLSVANDHAKEQERYTRAIRLFTLLNIIVKAFNYCSMHIKTPWPFHTSLTS